MIRFGVVSFVNSRLYASGLEELKAGGDDIQIFFAPPRQLSAALDAEEVDVALIPAYDFLRGIGAGYVPGHGIAGQGQVETVRLYYRDEPGAGPHWVNTILTDSRSASSVALVRVLMNNVYGRDPEYSTVDIDRVTTMSPSEGLLVIGDGAHRERSGCLSIDLCEAWTEWTGLPFVFALWVVRDPIVIPKVRSLLDKALALAESRLDEVVEQASLDSGFDTVWIRNYLTDVIRNRITEREMAGLREFARLTGFPEPPPVENPVRTTREVQT